MRPGARGKLRTRAGGRAAPPPRRRGRGRGRGRAGAARSGRTRPPRRAPQADRGTPRVPRSNARLTLVCVHPVADSISAYVRPPACKSSARDSAGLIAASAASDWCARSRAAAYSSGPALWAASRASNSMSVAATIRSRSDRTDIASCLTTVRHLISTWTGELVQVVAAQATTRAYLAGAKTAADVAGAVPWRW